MPKVVTPLSDSKIKNAKAKEKDYVLSDGNGLHLLIKVNNSKLWECVYNSPTTLKRRKISFGKYPDTTLLKAREERDILKREIKDGIDPIEKRKMIKDEIEQKEDGDKLTIGKVAKDAFELKKHNKKLKEETIDRAYSRLENHYFKYLPKNDKTSIFDITYKDTVKILQRLETIGKLSTLDRVKRLLINVFKYAYTEDILKDTELFAKLEIKNFKKLSKSDIKNRPTIVNPDEIGELLNSIHNYKGELLTKYALLLSIHTAQRQGNIISARWDNINLETKLWTIPSENMKMKREQVLPLSDKVVLFLKELKTHNSTNDYLFPNTWNNNNHMSPNTINDALQRMGYTKDRIVAHGFRAMFSTLCNDNISEHNINYEFIEKALAHQEKNEVRDVYNRANNLKEIKILMNWWSDYIVGLKNGK